VLSIRERTNCRICDTVLPDSFLSLGRQPPANNLLENRDDLEEYFPLELTRCSSCSLVQLRHVVDPTLLFKNYLYVPSTSESMKRHFSSMAHDLAQYSTSEEHPLAVDIGSNDGLLLSFFQAKGLRVLGVEPADNLAQEANAAGIPTIVDFFGEQTVREIIAKEGQADIITGTNVFAHIDDIRSVVHNVSSLINKKTGIFVIEAPDLLEMLEQGTFDLIYHEHLSYFGISPLVQLFKQYDMEIFRVDKVSTHGGSLRIYAQMNGADHKRDPSVDQRLSAEKSWISDGRRYDEFAKKAYSMRDAFTKKIDSLSRDGKKIAGYGLPAKANTIINFCKISSDQIKYIVDDNPLKQGKFAPGSKIPIVTSSYLDEKPVDAIVIFPWNIASDITAKLSKYSEQGVEFILPIK